MTPGLPAEIVAGLNGNADALDRVSHNGEVNTLQSGWGITPIVGLNIHLMDKLNIAMKYEHHTKIEVTNETEADDLGMFPDGAVSRADLPGMFAAGAQFSPIEKLTISAGFNYFLDIPAYYGKTGEDGEQVSNETTIDQNAYSFSASLEYKLLGILGLSAGYSGGNLGVNDGYQSDLSYALKSNTVAGGVFVDLGELLTINAGLVYVMYDDYTKSYTTPVPYDETFMKKSTLFAIGLDIHL
jgi:hypothetical protein